MKTVQGDLLDLFSKGNFTVILHGCNCFHLMGAGIARQIAEAYPEAYQADSKTPKGISSKLGTIGIACVGTGPKYIVNCYTQFHPGKEHPQALYQNIRSCLQRVYLNFRDLDNCKIGYPKIGAGIAGGDWGTIKDIFDEELKELDHTFVEYIG